MSETEMDGITLIRQARERVGSLRAIVLSMYDDAQHVDAAFAAGAVAYVLKTAHPDDLTSAIRQAFEHSIYLAGGVRPTPTPAAATLDDSPASRGGSSRSCSSSRRATRMPSWPACCG